MKITLFWLLILLTEAVIAQNNEVKSADDFELNGLVKTCEIQTAYGTEILQFNRDRTLRSIETIFSDSDKEKIRFTYENKMLSEKIIEVFRENTLRKEMSFYHKFIQKDSLIEEFIFSLEGAVVGRNMTVIDSLNHPIRRLSESADQQSVQFLEKRSSDKIDSILTFEEERLVSLEVIQKEAATQRVIEHKIIAYNDTLVARKRYEFYNSHSLLVRSADSIYDSHTGALVSAKEQQYSYQAKRLTLAKELEGNQSSTKRYLYQLDDNDPPNWVKRIEQPSNNYTTRRLIYYADNEFIVE